MGVKGGRYLAIVLVIVSVAVATAWLLRNRIAEQLSGPTLAGYGLKITDVSLDALAREGASIGRLVLEHENGMTIRITGLQLPLAASGTGDREYAAQSVVISGGRSTSVTRGDLASWLDDVLALPGALPHTTVRVDALSVEGFPVLEDVRWHADTDSQTLDLVAQEYRLSLQTYPTSAGQHNAVVQLQGVGSDLAPQALEWSVGSKPGAVTLDSEATIDPARWLTLLRHWELVPATAALSVAASAADLSWTVDVPRDVGLPVSLHAVIRPAARSTIEYRDAAGTTTELRTGDHSAFTLEAAFPSLEWSLVRETGDITVISGAFANIPITIERLACRSGITCTLASRVQRPRSETPYGNTGKLELHAESTLSVGEQDVRLDTLPGATMLVIDYVLGGTKIGQLDLESGASIAATLDADGLHVAADSLDVRIGRLSENDGPALTMPVFMEGLRADIDAGHRTMSVGIHVPSVHAATAGLDVLLPGLRGTVALDGDHVSADLATVGLAGDAAVEVAHDLGSGSGKLDVRGASLSFSKQPLASRVSPRQKTWNLSDGELHVDSQLQWTTGPGEALLLARAALQSTSIAGFYGSVAFGGLDTSLELGYDAAGGLALQPSSLKLGFVDAGFPVTNVAADYRVDVGGRSVQVDNLRMEAFGGVITADPFSFRTGGAGNHVTLHAQSLDLARMLSIEEFEAMEISGRVSAELPLTITGTDVSIDGGHLTGDAPGGVIRYKAGAAADQSTGIGIATLALSNFVYDSLTSDVNYGSDGNLVLKMRLTGRNPDMDSTRPIVLNLGLENNVRQMLRSLQAARHVEDVLKKRLEQ